MAKLKTVGVIFLVCLALGAGWALWIGLKLFAYIAIAGLAVGVAGAVATSLWSHRRLSGPPDRSRLG